MNAFFRLETSNQELANNLAPRFSNPTGLRIFTNTLPNPKYMAVDRNFPTTRGRWEIQNLLNSQKNTLRSWWDTTLTRGESDFTLIDHRKRFLFDASWNQWKLRWKKFRGGTSDVFIDFESPYDWTPPEFAFYPMISTMADHGLESASDLSLVDGVLETTGDPGVLRNNGRALRIGDSASVVTGASSTSLNWAQGKDNSSISLMLQFSVPNMNASKELNLIKLANGHILRIYVERSAANKLNLVFEWQESGSGAENISVSGLDVDVWYDVCLTFDNINNNFFGYYVTSATSTWSSTDDFLNGLTTLTDGILSDTSPTNFPVGIRWKECFLLLGSVGDLFVTDSPMSRAYVQNVMVMDDFISPLQFNTLRRLYSLWNLKTTGTWPK